MEWTFKSKLIVDEHDKWIDSVKMFDKLTAASFVT